MRRIAVPVLVLCLCLTGVVLPAAAARADISLAWEQIGQPMGNVWWPAVDPKDASYVCVVPDVGLCRSIDEGKIWGGYGRPPTVENPDSLYLYGAVRTHLQPAECVVFDG